MTKTMKDWFFMRKGFETFKLEPDRHCQYVFGDKDRKQRDRLLESLEEAAYSRDGHKAAIYGDYGRGKTHLCHNLIFEIERRDLPFVPVYVKCGAFKKKEPFSTLFQSMIFGLTSSRMQEVADKYVRRVRDNAETPLEEFVQSEDIAQVMSSGLSAPNPEAVKLSMRWLAGEPKINLTMIGGSLKPQLTDSLDFGAVARGVARLFSSIDGKVPLFIVDEAERFENITDSDTFFAWLAAIRELTEIPNVGLLFMIGAKTRDSLPAIFVMDEVIRRIGVANYVELLNPGLDALRSFLLEQLQTTIQKGEVPESQWEAVAPEALSEAVPEELVQITGGDERRLETFPFEPDAFDDFVERVASGEMANKPSEAQLRLQRAAQRAMRLDTRTITTEIVEAIHEEVL